MRVAGDPQSALATIAVRQLAKRLRLLIVDNDAEVRDYLQVYLQADHDIVGSMADGSEVLLRIDELNPDILLLDISMPGLNGFQVARHLRQNAPHIRIIFVTAHAEPAYLKAARGIGIEGYVLKSRAQSELLTAIGQVEEGASYFSPELR